MKTIRTSADSPLRIDTIALPGKRGQIGMTTCPGKKDSGITVIWDRDLDADIAVVSEWGATAVVTLLEDFELDMLGIPALPSLLQRRGIERYHLPIRDVDIPDRRFEEQWRTSGERIRCILSSGGRVLLHCRGGIGRTGTIAARLLVEFGFKPSDAVDLVRRTRPGTIETAAQEAYVMGLRKWPARPYSCTEVSEP